MSLATYLLGTAVIVLTAMVTAVVWLRRKMDRIYDGLE
jgi:hypothetical protein